MKKRWWIIAVVAVLLTTLGWFAWQSLSGQQAQAQEPLETVVVQRDTLRVVVNATGSLAPAAEVALAFPIGGRVAEVLVEEGQEVEAGQALVRLETEDLELQLAQAQAGLQTAEANLDKLLAEARPEDIAVARSSLNQSLANQEELQVTLAASTEQARLSWVQAANNLRDAQANLENIYWQNRELEDRLGEDELPDANRDAEAQAWRAVENAEAAMEQARLSYEQALQRQETSQRTARLQVASAQANLDRLVNGATAEDVAVAQASVEQARVSCEIAQAQLDKATLTAPFAGTITTLYVQAGEMAGAGQPVVLLSDLAGLQVEVTLDETDVAGVTVGQAVVVTVDAFPGLDLAGEVIYIAPVAQVQAGVVLYPVTVRLLPAGGATDGGQKPVLRAGMTTEVAITTACQEEALTVPLRSVETAGGQAYVDRWVDDHSERVAVELGLMTDTEIEITAGLVEGDVILVVPAPTADTSSAVPNPFSMFRGGGE